MKWRNSILFLFIACIIACDHDDFTPFEKKKTDLESMNVKGPVCLIIERKHKMKEDKEELVNTSISKYGKWGNLLTEQENGFKVVCSYDEEGKLIVHKWTMEAEILNKEKWKGQEKFINFSFYSKYTYDINNFTNKVEMYSNGILMNTTLMERDRNNHLLKEILIKYDPSVGYKKGDTITTLYQKLRDREYMKTNIDGKRKLRTICKYNLKGLLISTEEKDLIVYKDSIPEYSSGDLVGYSCEDINKNIVYTYKYDENDNVIHTCICDHIKDIQIDEYYKYQYDSIGNWTRCEEYDNLHDLVSYTTREIEYYPQDEKTGEVDYRWEKEVSPLEKQYNEILIWETKEEKYLNDEYVLRLFDSKIKEEYPKYKVIGLAKIIYHSGCTYHINFNVVHKVYGEVWEKENITAEIIFYLNENKYTLRIIEGYLLK